MRRSDQRQAYQELLAVIRGVRRRWRLRLFLRGLAATGAVAVVTALVAAGLFERFGDAPQALWAIRAGAAVIIAATALWLLVRPLLRRVDDEAVALYLEEHEPSLEAAVLSALEAGDHEDGSTRHAVVSDALLRRTLETAIGRVHDIGDGRWIERAGLVRVMVALVGVVVAGALLGFFGPMSARRGASILLSSPRDAEAAGPRTVGVEPGDATIARGADASVSAQLGGFDSELVELAVRTVGDSAFDRVPMARAPDGTFGYLLFDLDRDTEYYVEADGVRSAVHTLTVAELPYTDRLDLELVYPTYTGLPTETVEDGGDVTALRGTLVRVHVTPTVPVPGGGIVIDGADPLPLVPDSVGGLTGEFTVRQDGFYHIVLDGPGGEPIEASQRYVIDALSDGPPIVSFAEPGRDERATSIDEVYVEARAEDDYGVGDLTLHYSVNGGEERTERLYGAEPMAEVSAGHTFYLEELGLEPGDLVSYYATAQDDDAVDGRKTATSDIYFIQIRPFQRNYEAAEQRAPPPSAGQADQQPDGDLTERQRQIVAATFNIVRDSAAMDAAAVTENLNTLSLAQERLRDEARTLARRMVARQVTNDSAFQKIAELLPQAAAAMDTAAERLRRLDPGGALPSEQRALQYLQRAEAVFRDVQVSMGQQQGGGGGGGSPNAEDLADLFELEMDKLQDQYETVNRGGGAQQDSGQAAVDETLQRLEELARRQQREEERQRREAMQARGTSGGESQRELAEQVEEEARQLERLSREQRNPQLNAAAQRLRQAAESMRRSASGSNAQGQAVDQLREARRLLERGRTESLRRDAESARQRAEELAREQERIGRDAQRMLESETAAERRDQARRLDQRKARQQADVEDLQDDLNDLADRAGSEQPEAARRLREAAGSMSESRIEDYIDLSRQLAQMGGDDPRQEDYVRRVEAEIQRGLDDLRDRLEDVPESFDAEAEDQAGRAMDRAEDLARGLESMRARSRDQRERASGAPDGGNRLNPGSARQYQREARERLEDARALRRSLREQGLDTDDVERLMSGLEDLSSDGLYEDPEALERLQTRLADEAKRLELLLRVRLGGAERARLFEAGADAVPAEYRELVEEYYRSLSRENPRR